MGAETKIEWTDHSASPWYGCSEVHLGCDACYARELAKRNPSTLGTWGPDGVRVKSKSFVRNLRLWQKQAAAAGRIETVFPSLCDPFEDRSELEPWRREMFEVIDQCPNLRLLLLTKRPENVLRMWPMTPGIPNTLVEFNENGDAVGYKKWDRTTQLMYRNNVWLLTSVSDQPTADAMVPELLKLRDLVPVLGLSVEPLLGPVDLDKFLWPFDEHGRAKFEMRRDPEPHGVRDPLGLLNWVIVGGESGPHARPMHPRWARCIRDQCQAAGVPFFFKQWGEYGVGNETLNDVRMDRVGRDVTDLPGLWDEDDVFLFRIGKKAAGRLLDGREWSEFPETEPN